MEVDNNGEFEVRKADVLEVLLDWSLSRFALQIVRVTARDLQATTSSYCIRIQRTIAWLTYLTLVQLCFIGLWRMIDRYLLGGPPVRQRTSIGGINLSIEKGVAYI